MVRVFSPAATARAFSVDQGRNVTAISCDRSGSRVGARALHGSRSPSTVGRVGLSMRSIHASTRGAAVAMIRAGVGSVEHWCSWAKRPKSANTGRPPKR
jgi:hypothetical protein